MEDEGLGVRGADLVLSCAVLCMAHGGTGDRVIGGVLWCGVVWCGVVWCRMLAWHDINLVFRIINSYYFSIAIPYSYSFLINARVH